jgi:AcrR family transcriptional regulator
VSEDTLSTHLVKATILAAAMKLLSHRPLAEIRVEDILAGARIARRTFYRYFKSKEDVMAGLYEVATEELIKRIEAVRAQPGASPAAALRAGIDAYLDFHRDNAKALREIVELSMQSSSLLAPRRRWFQDRLCDVFSEASRAVHGEPFDPYVSLLLLGGFEGVSLELLHTGAKPADVERARKVVHAMLDQVFAKQGGRALPKLS